ncbi:unnamed protein product [Moneuplotes crassus]|uniref:Uncharacterized protein n=1 Tax=Euplotes crassus TaxID=5936 RepID=A0AAD1ULV7_EUPCR|nr:unnamed protein product [Moneuplotes crassus]
MSVTPSSDQKDPTRISLKYNVVNIQPVYIKLNGFKRQRRYNNKSALEIVRDLRKIKNQYSSLKKKEYIFSNSLIQKESIKKLKDLFEKSTIEITSSKRSKAIRSKHGGIKLQENQSRKPSSKRRRGKKINLKKHHQPNINSSNNVRIDDDPFSNANIQPITSISFLNSKKTTERGRDLKARIKENSKKLSKRIALRRFSKKAKRSDKRKNPYFHKNFSNQNLDDCLLSEKADQQSSLGTLEPRRPISAVPFSGMLKNRKYCPINSVQIRYDEKVDALRTTKIKRIYKKITPKHSNNPLNSKNLPSNFYDSPKSRSGYNFSVYSFSLPKRKPKENVFNQRGHSIQA